MKTLFDKVVVLEPEAAKEKRSEAGLLLPTTTDKLEPVRRVVITAGPDANVLEGDEVLLPPHTGVEFKVDEKTYKVFRADEILVIF